MDLFFTPSDDSSDDDWDDFNKVITRKTVRFTCATPSIIPILNEDIWYADYIESRNNTTFMLDRARFLHRIRETADNISWIFSIEHRVKISLRMHQFL